MRTVYRFVGLPDVPCRGEALASPVHWLGTQWAVTAYGIERRDGFYVIERDRIHAAENGYTLEDHIAAKEWADMSDFREALAFARRKWPLRKPVRRPIGAAMPDRPGKLVATLDMAASAVAVVGGEIRRAGRTSFVALSRHGPKGRAFAPAEQLLALQVDEIRATIRVLRQAEAKAVEKGLLAPIGGET